MARYWRVAARLHKWLGLFIGIQIFIWTASGLFFAIMPIETVRGEHLKREAGPAPVAMEGLAPLERVLTGAVTRAELSTLVGAPVWRLELGPKDMRLVDARTGAQLSPLDADWAGRIALDDYAGKGKISGLRLIEADPPIEYRGALPVWQVQFDDSDSMRIYVTAQTGKITARRTDTWRLYDFLWSLHIMDYSERESFNHPLLILAALSAFALTLFGMVLVVLRFRPPVRRGLARLFGAKSQV
jgi:uncharacterized iron-regulated membrane protein